MTQLFDSEIMENNQSAVEFITNILQSSTEYSIIAKDLKGNIVLWNEGARRTYGYEPIEVVGKMNSSYLHAPEDIKAKLPQQMMETALKEGKWEGQVNRVRKNGDHFIAKVVMTPRKDAHGKAIGFLLISKDITQELQTIEKLNYTRSLIESTIDALITTDNKGMITDLNQQMEKMTGYTRQEFMGSPLKQYFSSPHTIEEIQTEVLQKRKVATDELMMIGKGRDKILVSYSASVLLDGTEKAQGVLSTIRDITKQKLPEERFQKILEATPDAMVMINQGGKIVFINTQTEKIFGYEKNELLGQPVEILIPEPYRNRHPEHRTKYFSSPHVRPMGIGMELYGLRKNGEHFPVEISLSPFDTGENKTALAAVRDITDRKQIEQTLQEKNIELEKANLAKDQFLASMSHELRTPLNAILGFTGTLLMKLPGPLNEEQDKQLRTVQGSALHLLSLINDLLDLAKIESGKVELNFENIICQSVIEEVAANLAPMAENKGLSLKVKVPKNNLVINIDRRAFSQILINLLNNAIKFTAKGEVRIELNEIKRKGGDFLVIKVIDTGIGIKPEDQARLFKAFQQIATPSMRAEGTGLGLHVSQKLAMLMKSKISFESDYGKGSCFSIQLPRG